jgi:uncharacterized protein YecE (DUF72 family)
MAPDQELPACIRIGPAGWSYPDGESQGYPKPRSRGYNPLAHLAQYFDAIEIHSTCSRIPAATLTTRDAERAPDRSAFRFAGQVWQGCTLEGQASAEDRRVRA